MGFEMESMWEAMKTTRYQRIIQELGEVIRQTTTLDDALVVCLNKVVSTIHAEAGTFWFYDKYGDGRIHPRAVFGGKDLGDFSLAPGEGIAGQVIVEGQSVIIADCQKDSRWAGKADNATGFRTLSMLCVPLPRGRHVFGCIQIINKTDHTAFDDKDLILAENLAEHTAHIFEDHMLLSGEKLFDNDPDAAAHTEPTFSKIFSATTFHDVEEALLLTEAFSSLSESNQKNVLRHCREIWMTLDKNKPAPSSPKRKLFGSC